MGIYQAAKSVSKWNEKIMRGDLREKREVSENCYGASVAVYRDGRANRYAGAQIELEKKSKRNLATEIQNSSQILKYTTIFMLNCDQFTWEHLKQL